MKHLVSLRDGAVRLFEAYAGILFGGNPVLGAALKALTFLHPSQGVAGLAAVAAPALFVRWQGLDPKIYGGGFYTYNALLVGLSVGHVYQASPLSVFFAASCGLSAFFLTAVLAHFLRSQLALPVLSLPFVIVSSLFTLAAQRYGNLLVEGSHATLFELASLDLPSPLLGYLRSMGMIFFMPEGLAGLVVALAVLLHSRILFFLSVLGYAAAVLTTGWLTGSFGNALDVGLPFNAVLSAMAIGGVFLVPSLRSFAFAVIAAVLCTLVTEAFTVFWSILAVPVFTLPFNLVVLALLSFLGLTAFPGLNAAPQPTPEESVARRESDRRRLAHWVRPIRLPFTGRWTVWQAFDGAWTHKDAWRHAYDFVITDEQGRTWKGTGKRAEDFHAWGKPVLSPVRGRIVHAVSDRPDGGVGERDLHRNWGNLVVLHDERGFFVEISHFKKDSLKVKVGDWVEPGTFLGLCGNSGNSPEPHIHVQVQAIETVGAYTMPFCFESWRCGDRIGTGGLPALGEVIEPVPVDEALAASFSFPLDARLIASRGEEGIQEGAPVYASRMAADGTQYLECGADRVFFRVHEGTLLTWRSEGSKKSFASDWFRAFPRFPLADLDAFTWEDELPVTSVKGRLEGMTLAFLTSFVPSWGVSKGRYRYARNGSDWTVEGEISHPLSRRALRVSALGHRSHGLRELRFGRRTWRVHD